MNKKKQAALAALIAGAVLSPAMGAEAAPVIWVLARNDTQTTVTIGAPETVPASETDAVSKEAAAPPTEEAAPAKTASTEAVRRPYRKPDIDALMDAQAKTPKKQKAAASESGTASTISEENPMVVEADYMSYNSTTGDVAARGAVDIRHMSDRYETEELTGNSRSQKYVIPVPVKWTGPGISMEAENAEYDGVSGISNFGNFSGWSEDKYFFKGETGTYDRAAGKGLVQNGFFTTKHAVAKVPDYRIEADSIEIYPNDHYLAHNVSLFIKNTRVLTRSTYRGSLAPGNEVNLWTLIPRPSYDSNNGVGLENKMDIPLGGAESDLYFYAKLGWYAKTGFKPDVGFRYETAPGTFKLRYAKEESSVNDDHIWVEKRPSLTFDSRHFYLPGTDFYAGARGELGYWSEGDVEGNHKQWDVYISHKPITLGPHLTFDWRAGYLKDYYGYNGAIRRNAYYSLGLTGGYGIWRSWIRYTDNDQKGQTPYSFDTYDMDKPVYTGFKVQLTPLDAIAVSYSIDTVDGHLEHRDYTYYRDLHSFTAWIRYRSIDSDFEFMIEPKDFRF